MIGTFTQITNLNGLPGLYRGLSASLLRQVTYSTTRFGIYDYLKSSLPPDQVRTLSLIAIASISGFIGGVAGNPADILNVRMQHDAALSLHQRRNYKGLVDGLVTMTTEEGWKGLFRGVWPNSIRATLMTAAQLASYDTFKQLLITYASLRDNLSAHLTASFLAGFVATTFCSPFDVIKTRIMSSKETKGLTRSMVELYRSEGIRWIFRGWVPSFTRLGPQTIATFLFLEQHKKIYRELKEI